MVQIPAFALAFADECIAFAAAAAATAPGARCVGALAFIIPACLAVSTLSGNTSQVDKLWSVAPTYYAVVFALADGAQDPRLCLMAALCVLWSLRLSYNFSRRGGYTFQGIKFWACEEDYRWEVLRATPPLTSKAVWFLFDASFVCTFQLSLLFAIGALPAAAVYLLPASPLGPADAAAAAVMLSAIVIEWSADDANFAFQEAKHAMTPAARKAAGGDYAKGFLTTGLFGMCRHPNYAAEQTVWISFFGFAVAAGAPVTSPACLGAVVLVLLFQGSVNFSEGITSSKYPDYKLYQETVPCFLPLGRIFGSLSGDFGGGLPKKRL